MRGRELSYSQWLEENRAKRCTVDLGELKRAWTAKAEAELAELLDAQAKYDETQGTPSDRLARLNQPTGSRPGMIASLDGVTPEPPK
jgi:hypothetical protein